MSRLCCYWLFCIPTGRPSGLDDSPTTSTSGNGTWTPLGIGSAFLALLSLGVVVIAVSTDKWLLTEERLAKLPTIGQQQQQQQQNQNYKRNNTETHVKLTYSGLWRVCVSLGLYNILHIYIQVVWL